MNDEKIEHFLSQRTPYSRREIFEAIRTKEVIVNGKIVMKMGKLINPFTDKVSLFGTPIQSKVKKQTLKFYKPKNIISTFKDPKGRPDLSTFTNTLKTPLFPVGRLDRHTTGLLIFTNDGQLANTLLHPKFVIEKHYKVTLQTPLKDQDISKLTSGFFLEDGPFKATHVEVIDKTTLILVITEGRNRIIRRAFEALKNTVIKLHRFQMGPISLDKQRSGEFKPLSKTEQDFISDLMSDHSP